MNQILVFNVIHFLNHETTTSMIVSSFFGFQNEPLMYSKKALLKPENSSHVIVIVTFLDERFLW